MAPELILSIPMHEAERAELGSKLNRVMCFVSEMAPFLELLEGALAELDPETDYVPMLRELAHAAKQADIEMKWCCEVIGRAHTLTRSGRAH